MMWGRFSQEDGSSGMCSAYVAVLPNTPRLYVRRLMVARQCDCLRDTDKLGMSKVPDRALTLLSTLYRSCDIWAMLLDRQLMKRPSSSLFHSLPLTKASVVCRGC